MVSYNDLEACSNPNFRPHSLTQHRSEQNIRLNIPPVKEAASRSLSDGQIRLLALLVK
jgi:hypothetical protein